MEVGVRSQVGDELLEIIGVETVSSLSGVIDNTARSLNPGNLARKIK